jgi:hypothetical protein
MQDHEEIVPGSEAPGEQPAPEVLEAPAAVPSEAPAPEVAAEQKAGDACTCPDGRVGTLHANDTGDGFVCIPNQG